MSNSTQNALLGPNIIRYGWESASRMAPLVPYSTLLYVDMVYVCGCGVCMWAWCMYDNVGMDR